MTRSDLSPETRRNALAFEIAATVSDSPGLDRVIAGAYRSTRLASRMRINEVPTYRRGMHRQLLSPEADSLYELVTAENRYTAVPRN